jgi:DNA-binding NtrC family response regulator
MRLLIIGPLSGQLGAASKIAMDRGAEVAHAESVDNGLSALRSGRGADLLMVDAGLDIKGLIESLKTERFILPVVACGIGNDAQIAVRAIRAGAKEYIPLPPDAKLIAAIFEAVTEEQNEIVFRDPKMAEILKLASQIAPSNANVLITGPSGTGKELLANYVHQKSRRSEHRFVSVNCAAIPDNLLESELFGHEKGSFTGAVARRIGKFEEASGGTLLLDEISEMNPHLQAKLLRAVQEGEIERLGSNKTIKVDIRFIATSNRNLEDEVQKGTFREDLYYRLNVVRLSLPPLRERPADIEALAEHFNRLYSEANGIALRQLTNAAKGKLLTHSWRGNVRELENIIHRSVLLGDGTEIDADGILLSGHLQTDTKAPSQAADGRDLAKPEGSAPEGAAYEALVGRTVADVERDLILNTLEHCLGNRTRAANILGISIRTLRNKLKLYGEGAALANMPGEASRAAV